MKVAAQSGNALPFSSLRQALGYDNKDTLLNYPVGKSRAGQLLGEAVSVTHGSLMREGREINKNEGKLNGASSPATVLETHFFRTFGVRQRDSCTEITSLRSSPL